WEGPAGPGEVRPEEAAVGHGKRTVYRMTCMDRVLVTGATGNVGREVVSQLAATDTRVRAMTRNPSAAGLPAGVEVMQGDLTHPETLDRCLREIDSVFLVWTAPPAPVVPVF